MRLLWPWALWGLMLLPLLVWWHLRQEQRRARLDVALPTLRLAQHIRQTTWGRRRGLYTLLGALVAVILAATRPEIPLPVRREAGAVVLALDTSGSMVSGDVAPSRMSAVIEAASALLEVLPTTLRVGLVRFDDRATVVAPVGTNPAAIRLALSTVNENGSTNIAAAIVVSVQAVEDYRQEIGQLIPGRIVLLSDGEWTTGGPPSEAWPKAIAARVPVDTIGLRISEEGEATLREIARATGGEHMTANSRETLARAFWKVRGLLVWEWHRAEVSALGSLLAAALTVVLVILRTQWVVGGTA